MKQRVLSIGLILLLAVTVAQAAPGTWRGALSVEAPGAPGVVSYQGQVQIGEDLYDGTGYCKFAIVDGSGTSTWSNDGTSVGGSEPVASVSLLVEDGLFSLLLGDSGMPPLTSAAFADEETYLHVWFSSDGGSFTELAPATRISAVPYALVAPWAGIAGVPADLADGDDDTTYSAGTGIHIAGDVISARGSHYAEVVVVAKSGGDYDTIQAAIDAVKGAASYKEPYLVWVAPGLYEEEVIMTPYVHLQGAGREATVLSCAVSGGTIPPKAATLILASNSSVRDLTVLHEGTGYANVAVMGVSGIGESLLTDVDARAEGGGEHNIGVLLNGSGTEVALENVAALGKYGSDYNYGLHLSMGAKATVQGGSFTARGGVGTRGILCHGCTLEMVDATVLGEAASDQNYGLDLTGGAAWLRSGTVSGLDGVEARGISVTNGTLQAERTSALAETTGATCTGLYNRQGTVTLAGGAVIGSGEADTTGINNDGGGTAASLEAHEVIVQGISDDGNVHGLWNHDGAAATLYGGSVEVRGAGDWTYAVLNHGADSSFEGLQISALAEGSGSADGLRNEYGTAILHGGSYVARGPAGSCIGVTNRESGAVLEARNVTGLAEDCSGWNIGLFGGYDASTLVLGGEFTGRGGGSGACGIEAWAGGQLDVRGVTARGLENTYQNIGVYTGNIDVTVANSVLEGSSQWAKSTFSEVVTIIDSHLIGPGGDGAGLSCLAVTWNGGFYESSCP